MAADARLPVWRTLRFRLAGVATIVVAAVLVVTAALLLENQRRTLTNAFDEALAQRADDIAAQLDAHDVREALPRGIDDDAVAQVVDAEGNVVVSSANLDGAVALGGSPEKGEEFRTTGLLPGDSHPFRLLSRRVDIDGATYVIHVAGNPDDINESVGALGRGLLLAIPAVTALLAALLWWLTGRALHPVEAIRAEVAAMDGVALGRRVPASTRDDEIGRLARTMNSMLDRIEVASLHQQQFVADASHDLRSPLTRMRSELEVDLAHPEAADLLATHRSVLDDTIDLQRLVDDLLHLARADAGASFEAERVDLDDLVLREAQRLRAAGRVRVDAHAVSAAQVTGDRRQLARAVRNLTENAERHARSVVTLEVSEVAGTAVVVVADDGPGIAPGDRDRIFERFTRLDDARQASTGGAGLGLAIVRDIVVRHHGTVTVSSSAQTASGARFVITLPTGP